MGSICSKNGSDVIETLNRSQSSEDNRLSNQSIKNSSERITNGSDVSGQVLFSHTIRTTGTMPTTLDTNNKFVDSSNEFNWPYDLTKPLPEILLENQCPNDIDDHIWVFQKTIEFANQIKDYYSSIESLCTTITCPEMGAGPHFKYLWTDKALSTCIRVSANEYVHMLYNMISQQMDPDLFQNYYQTNNYPRDYLDSVQQIYKRLFRVMAHIFHHHSDVLLAHTNVQQLNTFFIQFCYFGEFNGLLTQSDEYPVRKYIRELKKYNSDGSASSPVDMDNEIIQNKHSDIVGPLSPSQYSDHPANTNKNSPDTIQNYDETHIDEQQNTFNVPSSEPITSTSSSSKPALPRKPIFKQYKPLPSLPTNTINADSIDTKKNKKIPPPLPDKKSKMNE